MKLLIFIILTLFGYNCGYSQNQDNSLYKIPLKLILPENLENLDKQQLSEFNSRITYLTNQTSLSAGENAISSFYIYPKILINNISSVETGMENIFKTNLSVALTIRQVENNIIFNSIIFSIEGYGKSKSLSITNALHSIPNSNKELDIFFYNTKKKIINYYDVTCSDIITQSQAMANMQKYESAIALLYSIPKEVDCFNKIQSSLITYYKALQNKICNSKIQDAKTKIASRDFMGALYILQDLDPSTKCFNESEKLISICKSNISEIYYQEIKMSMMIYKNEIELEKARIEACTKIAQEYYRSQPKTIIYDQLLIF